MKTLMKCQFGSHLYGTNIETSDIDYKAIYMPDARDILFSSVKETISNSTNKTLEKNSVNDVDYEIFSLKKYMMLLLQGQSVALDMFFVSDSMLIESSDVWENIRNNKHQWLHKSIHPYISYAKHQAAKYGIKGSRLHTLRKTIDFFSKFKKSLKLKERWDVLEKFSKETEHTKIIIQDNGLRLFECAGKMVQEHNTFDVGLEIFQKSFDDYGNRAKMAESNEGIDWKALMHAVRVANQGIELLKTHNITFPRPEKEMLLSIRKGEIPYKNVSEIIEELFLELQDVMEVSTLPEHPNNEFMKDFVCNEYKNVVLFS